MDNPLVSVIIPVYNCERYLGAAIQSALDQSYSPLEVIVVDDGSDDHSAEVAKQFGSPVRYSLQPHAGAGAARNHGVELAQGVFLTFLDADDLWVTDKLALQMAAFDADPTLDIVAGHVRHFHSPELDESIAKKIYCPPDLMPGHLAGALIRRDFFERVGPLETNWQIGEFISWYMRATESGARLLMIPDLLVWRRLHETNSTLRNRQRFTEYAHVLKTSLDRRRAAK